MKTVYMYPIKPGTPHSKVLTALEEIKKLIEAGKVRKINTLPGSIEVTLLEG